MKPRYTQENQYYIKDQYTGQHLNITETCKRLNQYEQTLQESCD